MSAIPNQPQEPVADIEAEIDALISEFGTPRAAIAVLLHDLGVLANDMNAATSRGYTRGKIVEIRRFRRKDS